VDQLRNLLLTSLGERERAGEVASALASRANGDPAASERLQRFEAWAAAQADSRRDASRTP